MGRTRALLAALVVVGAAGLVAGALAMGAASTSTRRAQHRDPHYATMNPAANARRQAQIRWHEDDDYDSSLETCLAVGLRPLAERLGVTPTPLAVARAYAHHFMPALRAAPYHGCLDALREHPLRPPR
jgi:hypothetical protein